VSPPRLRLAAEPLAGLPEVRPGDDLPALIANAAEDMVAGMRGGEVLVVAQKVVSKAEGRLVRLGDVEPGERARELASRTGKDPRLVQLILDESEEVLRVGREVLIVRTRHGLVCANAGIDQSNVPDNDVACLLPEDPDASARALRRGIGDRLAVSPAVVVSDSFGRAWRLGQLDVAIGCAGLSPLNDRRGEHDAQGRALTATIDAVADAATAAASLVRHKAGGEAVVIVHGLERHVTPDDGPGAATIVRPLAEDLFT
jgi:coenzyme F420-0:L-glutamate ligase / coenzyme F420-1:gamma-L-glutamate ligase